MGKKSDETISILESFKKRLERKIKLDRLILFGSRARKDARIDSDFDLIIVSKNFEGQKSFKRPIKFYAEWDSDYDTDIICLTPRELEIKKKQIGIIKNAIKEGIIIK